MKLHERIAKLLAKAESTDSLEEAAAFVAKAQQLATLYAIDLRTVEAAVGGRPQEPTHRTQVIGRLRARANKHLIALYYVVAVANDVQLDVASNSTFVITYGLPSDLDVVEQLWASLAVQMGGGAHDYIASGAWRSEGLTSPQARATFQQHFIHRIGQRLQAARRDAAAEHDTEHGHDGTPGTGSTALVVLERTHREVSDYRDRVSQARGTWRGYSGRLASSGSGAARAGRAAADRARLSTPDALPGGGSAIGD